MDQLSVKTYAGARAEEYPVRFSIGGRNIEVVDVTKRWLTPECRCFEVLGNDGCSYVLEYNSNDDTWRLTTINRP